MSQETKTEFKNRVFGCVIVKSINSNFNADFTHYPRTLPDGVVYSTDKALKYTIKDYFRKIGNDQQLFYVKRYNDKMNPITLNDTYKHIFGSYPKAPVDKYCLFYFDGEDAKGVLPKVSKKKQVTDYFKSLEPDSLLIKYQKDFEALAGKDALVIEESKVEKPNAETEMFYYTQKNVIKTIDGNLDEIKQICEELENKLTGGINKFEVLKNLLTCLDIRLFGATFADGIDKVNISIHGPVQINHGVNRFMDGKGEIINEPYTEDILSPFASKENAQMSTIGNQTNLKEGHYVFHFSVNPKNTEEYYAMINKDKSAKQFLSSDDIDKLKEAFNNSVTALDSSRKIGSENEATVWIQLKEGSKKMLPSLTELVIVNEEREMDFSKVCEVVTQIKDDIEKVEVFYNPVTTKISGLDKCHNIKLYNILNNDEIK
ncbi:MAG: type I CRISPR-associated protein Cas7 [Bacteroidetes bacterium]|nr:type I CRISPR-associated protein Cas7 [Bacteroidota bacterium]